MFLVSPFRLLQSTPGPPDSLQPDETEPSSTDLREATSPGPPVVHDDPWGRGAPVVSDPGETGSSQPDRPDPTEGVEGESDGSATWKGG